MDKIAITEEMNVHKEWYEEATSQNIGTLPVFMSHVLNDYEHDYGTICHAIAACAFAAACAADRSEQGFITGFQAGCVMWEFIKHWTYGGNKTGMRLLDYDNMLFPQYEYKFSKTISKQVWERLQEEATKYLEDAKNFQHDVNPNVKAHWESIVDGNVPFGYEVEDD